MTTRLVLSKTTHTHCQTNLDLGEVVVVEGRPLQIFQSFQVRQFADVLTVQVQSSHLQWKDSEHIYMHDICDLTQLAQWFGIHRYPTQSYHRNELHIFSSVGNQFDFHNQSPV